MVNKTVVWLDSTNTVRATDGFREEEIGPQIRDDIATIAHSNASMAYHSDGIRNWVLLSDGTKLYLFDLDRRVWMPPWVRAATALHSGEVSAGSWKLFYGLSDGKVLQMLPTTYSDLGASYAAFAVLQLLSLGSSIKPGMASDLEYVGIERNAVALSDVKQLMDEDPDTGTYNSINANKVAPPLRSQGTNLLEEWFYSRTPAARRVSVRFEWAAATTNFKLYSFDLASREMEQR
jgi:hypothetical protein